ncbi:MAG: alpha/beta fold hydrolase [Candidatus Zambryskibacteria bacterium]|nr:alpha/beta fold hydrolase [Candidatus Zambryskibacteria bacterium]
MVTKNITSIELKTDSNREFFLVHGYTGSPTDFKKLPYLLNQKFDANVRIILLPGHGTKVEDLDDVTYEDLINALTVELEKDIKLGREIVIGGVSLGGLFALLLASKYSVNGLFNIYSPYVLKFPFNSKGLALAGKHIKYWKKLNISARKREMREGLFSYSYIHGNGLSILKRASNELQKNISNVICPTISISSNTDSISRRDSLDILHNNLGSIIKKKRRFSTRQHNFLSHNIFFSEAESEIYEEIINFVESNSLFSNLIQQPKRVVAIVPSYNEAPRIGNVLEVITKVNVIDEIIVVDDGSIDSTEEIVKKFKDVKYLRNDKNIGKAESMERGVRSTNASILFFCDADLINITKEIIQDIITPVIDGKFSMFIGLRGNIMQKTVHLFAINSGERALTREVWEKLPYYFKYKYRVEAGLNYYVRKYFGGFGVKTFNYSQPIKEKKYGFLRGTYLRWSMNIDVFLAYLREIIETYI